MLEWIGRLGTFHEPGPSMHLKAELLEYRLDRSALAGIDHANFLRSVDDDIPGIGFGHILRERTPFVVRIGLTKQIFLLLVRLANKRSVKIYRFFRAEERLVDITKLDLLRVLRESCQKPKHGRALER